MHEVCKVLGETLGDLCVKYVESYTDQIIKMLVDELNPKQICVELTAC